MVKKQTTTQEGKACSFENINDGVMAMQIPKVYFEISELRILFLLVCLLPAASLVAQQPPEANDPAVGVTIQLPVLGVSIDAAGMLTAKVFNGANRQLNGARQQAILRAPNGEVRNKSKLRKVSLKRLEAAVSKLREHGESPTEEMLALAGLQRIQYVFVLPDDEDVLIAGPAEDWVADFAGRRVGLTTGRPTLLLEELVVAIRTFGPAKNLNTWVGCSINPTAEGIRNLNEFKKQIPSRISMDARQYVQHEVASGLQESLGIAKIEVFGIPRKSHLAQVLVEADYRMKLIAIGLESPPIKMTTFIEELRGAPRNMQRWWLHPNYRCIKESQDGLGVEFVGRGVNLSTENITFGQRAQVQKQKLKPSRAARRYANSFTRNYEALSDASPVFAQLRNAIDVLVAAAWIRKQDGYQKSGWSPSGFLDPLTIDVETEPDPKTAPAVANAIWKGNVLIAPVGGGVSIQASDAFSAENLIRDKDDSVQQAKAKLDAGADDRWWWD